MTALHYNAAQDTLDHLLDQWKDNPKRKGAVADIKRIKTQFQLEREVHETTGKTVLRSGVQRAADIAFARPVDQTNGRIKEWLKDLFAFAFVIVAICMAASFAAAFNPLYDAPQTTIQSSETWQG